MREKRIEWLLLTIFSIVLAFSVQGSSSQSRASYGEACDKGIRCDSRASLTCTNGTCQCVKENEMTYDKKREKCVVFSGERCSYTAIETLFDAIKEKRWTERLDCVENAICKDDGYCGCKPEFFENSKGVCVPKISHGGNCTKDLECRGDKHLHCVNGTCSCNEAESVFDSGYGQCMAKVGASCMKYGMCVRNANCQRQRGLCCRGGRDWDSCQCSTDYKRSKVGLCLGNYDTYCDSLSSPCSEDLSCIDGKCGCHFPQHQLFNRTLGECVSFVRGPCSEERNGIQFEYLCGENAECKTSNGLAQCQCKEGYIESDNKQCRLAYGALCKHSDVCDKVANLTCENGKCACKDLQAYDHAQSRCRGLVGAVCYMEVRDFCTDGAQCVSFRDWKMGTGVCQCSSGYIINHNRRCKMVSDNADDEENGIESLVNGTTTEESTAAEVSNDKMQFGATLTN